MSLILDALRKSEAERRRGQAPDLYAELPPLVPRAATRRPAWPWWLAGGFALLATLWMLRDVQSLAGATTAPAAEATAAIAVPPAEIAPASTAAQPTVAVQVPVASIATAPAAPHPAPAPAAREAAAAAAMPAATTASSLPAPSPVTEPALQLPQPAPASTQVASASPPPPATASAPVASPAGPAPLHLADLSAGEREQLPALKISMHMWGPTPDQRFAIIDGARVSQGDRVGDAVVEEIGADSVVLNWHGQRLALPIR